MTWGVGIIGSGPGVAALHAPTLARDGGDFRLRARRDAGSGRGRGDRGTLRRARSAGVDDAPRRPGGRRRRRLQPAAAARRARAREPGRGAAGDLLRETARRHGRGGRTPRRRVRRRSGRCWSSARTTSSTLPGRGPRTTSAPWTARISAVTVTLCAAAQRPLSRVTMASRFPAGAAPERPPLDLDDPAQRPPWCVSSLAGLARPRPAPRARPRPPDSELVVCARAVPRSASTWRCGRTTPGALTTVMLPGGADALWRVTIATASARIEVDSRRPSCTRGAPASASVRRWAGRRLPDDRRTGT